jgi:hypothetical protein
VDSSCFETASVDADGEQARLENTQTYIRSACAVCDERQEEAHLRGNRCEVAAVATWQKVPHATTAVFFDAKAVLIALRSGDTKRHAPDGM